MKHSAQPAKKSNKIVLIAVAAVVVVAAIVLVSVFSCGNNKNEKEEYVPEYQKGTTIISPYYEETPEGRILPTSGNRHDITVIEGGGTDAADLLGEWVDEHNATRYLFDGKDRGIMLTAVDNYTFVYSAQDGKLRIDIDIDTRAEDIEYSYTIKDDKLTMVRGGQTYTFTKVEQ